MMLYDVQKTRTNRLQGAEISIWFQIFR